MITQARIQEKSGEVLVSSDSHLSEWHSGIQWCDINGDTMLENILKRTKKFLNFFKKMYFTLAFGTYF